MNKTKNKHFQMTDQRIQEVLFEIINENKNPTIVEICRRLHINRTTFYLHYIDITDLLTTIQDNIFKEFIDSIVKSDEKLTLLSFRSYELFAMHVLKNKEFYRL